MIQRSFASPANLPVLAAVFLLAIVMLQAQPNQKKWQACGGFGFSRTAEDEGSLGSGMVLGGGLGYRLTDRWGLEVGVHRHSNQLSRGAGQFFADGSNVVVSGAFLYHFSSSKIQPFVRLGAGYARFDGATGFRPSDLNAGFETAGTQDFLGLDVGAGLKFFLSERVSIRPEFRFFAGGSGQYDSQMDPVEPGLFLTSLSVGVGYHW